ncbi:MAG: PDZ domain-containing protein [Tabrizicola sp.]|nr:PDZ domain-containing protein [Tabrizicola sp.]
MVLILILAVSPARAEPGALETAMDAVFTVRSADAEDRFLGSAFLWDGGEVAVTNAHVVGEAAEVRLRDRNGAEEIGLVIARDPVRDVAVISVAPGRRGLAPVAGPLRLGTEVFALGAPLGIEFTLTEGLVSAKARQVEVAVPIRMLQHDAAVNPGSSGGPLVDANGGLLGMNSRIADGSRMFVGIAYAIVAEDLDRIVTGLIEETLPPFPALGLRVRPMDRQLAAALGVTASGLLIDGVEAGGLAEAGGLRAGDIVLAVDGKALAEPGDFAFAIEAAVAAGEAGIAVYRGHESVLVMVPLGDADQPKAALVTRDLRERRPAPARVESYSMTGLGLTLGADGSVEAVTANSPALLAGLAQGDRILAINGTGADLAMLRALRVTGPLLILLAAPGGTTRHIYLDPWAKADGLHPVGGANVLDPDVVVF